MLRIPELHFTLQMWNGWNMSERDRKPLSSKPVTYEFDVLLDVIFISLRHLLTEATLL
jgi:hypothetical protein